jgi:transposase-like protein
LLAIKSMGGESTEAWRAVLDDLIERGLRGARVSSSSAAPGLEKAIAAVWNGVPAQRCTVNKHRKLLAHAPKPLHEEITADYNDMIYGRRLSKPGFTCGLRVVGTSHFRRPKAAILRQQQQYRRSDHKARS